MYLAGDGAVYIISGLIYSFGLEFGFVLKFRQAQGLNFYFYIYRSWDNILLPVITPKLTLCSFLSDRL